MFTRDSWLLPEGIEEVFPNEAERLDRLGRRMIDRFSTWGYRLVMPPVIDFLDSLLVGTGHDLDTETLKLTDPASGRLIGLRADITPQVARLDARSATPGLPSRLCYVGSVVHALSGHLEKCRNPIQVGAELYGHAGVAAVGEVIRLMLDSIEMAGVRNAHLDLGHVGIYRALAGAAGLTVSQEAALFEILQRKDPTDLECFLRDTGVNRTVGEMIVSLLDLNGPAGVVDEARTLLRNGGEVIGKALDELASIVSMLKGRYPTLGLNLDLAELRGYHYHTGAVFAAFVPGQGREIARGGRYDDIGRAFGHARPAVGFSADLKMLARLSDGQHEVSGELIFAPVSADSRLEQLIDELRNRGKVVIQSLGGETADSLGCRQSICEVDGHWRVL